MLAPFRINRPPAATAAPRDSDDIKHWMERLIKLVPTEVVAVYLAGRGYAESMAGLWSLCCVALVVIIRIWGTHVPTKGPQVVSVLVSAISFVIWVFAIGGRFPGITLQPNIASLLVLVWTVVVPIFYKGD